MTVSKIERAIRELAHDRLGGLTPEVGMSDEVERTLGDAANEKLAHQLGLGSIKEMVELAHRRVSAPVVELLEREQVQLTEEETRLIVGIAAGLFLDGVAVGRRTCD